MTVRSAWSRTTVLGLLLRRLHSFRVFKTGYLLSNALWFLFPCLADGVVYVRMHVLQFG